MRVLVTRALTPRVAALLRDEFAAEFRERDAPMTLPEARDALAAYDALLPTLGDALRAEAFTGPIRAKLLANFGVGVNHIDVAAAKAAGMAVTNTPGAVTDATADIAMTLLLMSARRASEGERMLRAGGWTGWAPTQMLGAHVTGKRLGVIGMGRIGQAVAKRAHFGFGMPVSYAARSPKILDVPALPLPLPDLLAQSDFVVLAVPATPETRHLIGAAELALMPPHAHLINVARGDVVDEAALIEALARGRIGGAGLDVYEREPTVPPALRGLENVTLLPHLGTATEEVRDAMGLMAVENLRAFRDGTPLPNAL
ncbi:D-glycerate dehydrogenase [Rhodobacter capsulatus]|uniref:2-hydroxyacid dehydrogenase n=1 Tax=Rhodobacter capsulatus TaxID=1061 RepID=UPI0006DC6A26|nr:D-glycerate dehydrogenase [Rhodobacter capsulatus]KQB11806.1 D-glycerate dehydrogenase [Rhodobacter capsulatus]KQB11925.1 D-glycerate dehydrogenase [Rhodobacter capsulatus]PZX23733.1 gluconate 2-dehydrogenase [Rhodobacter capsulatus]QNR62318.1 D-glycerate dehydrogenase [Rhodobacter capsulatus]